MEDDPSFQSTLEDLRSTLGPDSSTNSSTNSSTKSSTTGFKLPNPAIQNVGGANAGGGKTRLNCHLWDAGSKSIQNRGTKSIQKFIRSTSNLATRQIGSDLGTQANPAAGVESWDGPVECDIGKTQIPKRLGKTLPSPKSVTGVSSGIDLVTCAHSVTVTAF